MLKVNRTKPISKILDVVPPELRKNIIWTDGQGYLPRGRSKILRKRKNLTGGWQEYFI